MPPPFSPVCSMAFSLGWQYGATALAMSARSGIGWLSSRITRSMKPFGSSPPAAVASSSAMVRLFFEPFGRPAPGLLASKQSPKKAAPPPGLQIGLSRDFRLGCARSGPAVSWFGFHWACHLAFAAGSEPNKYYLGIL